MPKKSLTIEVKPELLKWVTDSAGWKERDISKKLKINQNVFSSWLKGEANPTLRQLEDLAKIVKRPLAVFFLPKAPTEKPLPKDYRMLPEKAGKFDKKTILAIRRARRLQKISKELSENLNANLNRDVSTVKQSEDPKKIAEKYREKFKFDEVKQKKFKTPYEVFNFLRDTIEDKNIIVFQISMPIEDARGFALVDESPAVIVVNSKDQIEARIFTLMHEFGHVLLNESGVSMPENSLFFKNVGDVEKWCNNFSSDFLLPEILAKSEFNQNKDIAKLSRTYKVSKAMLFYNMYRLNFISKQQYDGFIDKYVPEILKPKEKAEKKSGFRSTADKQCLSERGQKFVSLVVNNVDKGFITHSDALGYLSIKSKNLDKVMSKAKK
ncbi:TPA: ImmA/IrrE family metallo-endopeptidase [Candidatus Woesearchaeota archaeon]|nr:ImmA/IrrE family metallo-endopeptidase [Candidatus Woesearchaeota archaeon]HIH54875.1 ImmA/IrrE family metallo-endopeptidase [Candidatus Woesearchaeota archaeon]HIJ02028.1 ImmA/IrrE family metallo-endopeptidase [Candidatus Woesearchaeota archaeon]HIJ13289.1 ImmA/IrrE family metallo-endopeptidase [Candidatus Woesearchaeota archaeon]